MRLTWIVVALMATVLPCTAIAGPEGSYTVRGVEPGTADTYTGTVKISRSGQLYRVVWNVDDEETIGLGVGLRLVDGRMVAGAASDADVGITVSYVSDNAAGNATYTVFPDGTWRGVWIDREPGTLSTEDWLPVQTKEKESAILPADTETASKPGDALGRQTAVSDSNAEDAPARVLSSPLPASTRPKS